MKRRRRLLPALVATALLPLLGGALVPVAAADVPAGQIVGVRPSGATPHVLDGRVLSVVEVGDTMVLGGGFTRARNPGASTELSRSRLLAFDAGTGRISTSFLPQPNGTVNVVLPAGDGTSVYVGGTFTSIGGVARKNLARVRLSDGAVLSTFNTGGVSGAVRDLRLSGGRLWVAGAFTHIGGRAQTGLATVDATTGRVSPYMSLPVRGIHNSGSTNVLKIDVTPDGSQLVGVGNFDTVDGVKRHQMVVLDTSGPAPTVNFGTRFYETPCARAFDTYMRDVDVSPDGRFFVVSTTGAHGGPSVACDTTARFETASSGAAVVPSWIDTTGGDTTYAVEITDSVVYTGGHARWQNNSFAGDRAGQGAVSRPGIAALDPVNGLPLSWNPGRARGVGVFDFHVTDRGLYVASDTDRIGASYYRARIALMPAAGSTFPAVKRPRLPDDIHLLGSATAGAATVTARHFDGGAVTTADRPVSAGGVDWNQLTGGFMINGRLYAGWRDGSFTRQAYDGATFGPRVAVDTSDLLVRLDNWHNDVVDITGLFFDQGRLYYTLAGSDSLYYRYFTPESDVVGAVRYTAAANVGGFDPTAVRGMFLAGPNLFWADAAGTLRRTPWVDGAVSGTPRAGATTVVSGPGVDGRSWSARALAAFQDPSGNGSGAPTAPDQETAAPSEPLDGSLAPVATRGRTGAGRVHRVTVPSSVRPGDALLLFFTLNSAKGAIKPPTGWSLVERGNATGFRSRAWVREAVPADAGRSITVRTARKLTSDITLGAYRSSGGAARVTDSGVAVTSGKRSRHVSPRVAASGSGSWVVTYYGGKSRDEAAWTAPAGQVERRSGSSGTGRGSVSALSVDSGAAVDTGGAGGLVARTDRPMARTAAYSVVLAAG